MNVCGLHRWFIFRPFFAKCVNCWPTNRERLKCGLTDRADVRLHGDDRHLWRDRMVTIYSAVHRPPVAVQLLTFALLPPEVHPDSEADKSGRDQRRRYDDSRQFRYSKKIINNIITLQIESLPHKRNKLNPLIAH